MTIQDVMVNPDLQIVLQFVASAAVADFAFQLQNPGLFLFSGKHLELALAIAKKLKPN
jgi:hypothetical protein